MPVIRTRRALAFGAMLLTMAASPAAAEPQPRSDALRVRSLMDFRNDRLVRQEWDLTCGAAVVATLLTYQLGDRVTERQAALGMLRSTDARLVRARLGFTLLDLKHFAASRGFEAAGYAAMSVDELVQMAPVIAPIIVMGFPHFVVVRGRRGDRLLIGDPAFGNRTMTIDAFARAWPSRIGFTIHRAGETNPPNRMGAPRELFLTPLAPSIREADAGLRRLGSAP